MVTAYELGQVRRRVDQLAIELEETRRGLDVLEKRVAAESEKDEPASTPVMAKQAVSPPPLPPPVAVPPREPMPSTPAPERAVAPVVEDAARAVKADSQKPRPVASVVVEPAGPSPLQTWLERLQLWPPSADDGEGAEARLGAWWTTRIGMLLAVVGVVYKKI